MNNLMSATHPVGQEPGFGRALQNTLAPSVLYKDTRVEAYGRAIPREEVGGDLVDLVTGGGGVNAYVADVSGHGLPAGVLMGMLKTALRYGLLLGQPWPAILASINRVVPAVKEPNMYATLAALRFDGSNEAEYIAAGHVPVLHCRRRQRDVVRCSMGQFPLGLFEGVSYESVRIRYEPGDLFALVTDGVVETGWSDDEEFGLQRLGRILNDMAERSLPEIFEAALEAVARHGAQHDDQTLLLVRTLA